MRVHRHKPGTYLLCGGRRLGVSVGSNPSLTGTYVCFPTSGGRRGHGYVEYEYDNLAVAVADPTADERLLLDAAVAARLAHRRSFYAV